MKMNKNKDCVKYNTVPKGKILIILFWIFDSFIAFMSLCALAVNPETTLMTLPFVLIISAFIAVFYWNKYGNVLTFTNEKITLKKESISWKDVCMTSYCPGPTFLRNNYDVYIFFGDHYLTLDEVRSRKIKRKGFYIILNYDRAQYILSHYSKSVRVLNGSPIDRDNVMGMIYAHNVVHD